MKPSVLLLALFALHWLAYCMPSVRDWVAHLPYLQWLAVNLWLGVLVVLTMASIFATHKQVQQ